VGAIFGRTFPIILILGGVGLVISFYRALGEPGFLGAFFLHLGVYVSACLAYLFRLRLSVLLVFSFMLVIGYVIAIQSLFSLGLAGTGIMHLVILCTFACVFLGLKAGMITLMAGGITLAIIGFGISSGVIKMMPEAGRYLSSPANWIMQLFCYFMYMTTLVFSVNGLREKVGASIRELRENNARLEAEIERRRLTEEKLKESERRFEELADSLPQPIAEFDLAGKFTFGNATGFELFGYTKEEYHDNAYTVYQMLVPEDHERAKEGLRRVIMGQERLDNREYTALRKDGTTFPIMVYASPVIREGRPSGFRTVLVDITERKKFERALMESEAKYRSVVESSLVGFYIVQDNLFRYVNRRWCEIFGYGYEEVIDRLGPADIAHPDDKEKVEENIGKRLTDEKDYIEFIFRALSKDGRTLTVKALGSAIIYNDRPAATGTVIDITREKHLESHLRQAQKMEAIGTLTGGIAHDFNNILTALVGYGSLLQMRMDNTDPLRIYVDRMLSAAHKASGLTKSLLTFGRQQPINLQPTNINGIIQGTEQLLKRLLTEDIAFETRLTADNVTIMADATQIDQILFNLVTNAGDSMPKGGTLIIETRRVILDRDFALIHGFGEPGTYAVLTVSDAGVGMTDAVMEKIFEPFFTTKETGKGTGLGLATAYGIVKQHNGYITVYSEVNVGTTFKIYFPVVKTKVDEEQPVSFNMKRGNETILVAEDNEEVRRFVRDIFRLYGYRIVEAVDGEDAVKKFREQRVVDLVILDSVMPRKNGREAYDEIIKIKPDIKVLFMSGHTRDILLDKGIQEREFAFISKPLLPNELLQKAREILDT
jgi:two-component system, cell cycle sensor histidine kinase and response regulator CckA